MIVVNEDVNERIDKYLASITDLSRETITKMIDSEYILVNGKKVKASYKPVVGDKIEIKDGFVKDTKIDAKKLDLDIVYEDEYLMVINKPSGLVVHPGSGNKDNTLVNGLMYYTKNLSDIGDSDRPGIVHRLDKDTSGLMLVAKENKTHVILAEEFKKHNIHREYIALVDGVIEVSRGTIDAPIKRSKENYQKMTVAAGGKKAITNFEVIKRYKNNTLIRLVLETGRTHQIRVHMAYIGYPIHNDPVYNKKVSTSFGQFLHSEYLKFIHPITKKELEFRCPLPDEFKDYLNTLE
ncbi:MAG TPA: RluA family pseudouridine synthase [Candidatus Onthocola stercorigallinarum]|nr:RluA family pseudouridine synthase [Candidatus Onthocola stercorigallinarum]